LPEPQFEARHDRRVETEIMGWVQHNSGWVVAKDKSPRAFWWYGVAAGQPDTWFDVHVRKTTYLPQALKDGYMLKTDRWDALRARSKDSAVVLVVGWCTTDYRAAFYQTLLVKPDMEYPVKMAGRTTQTRAAAKKDHETCVFIPMDVLSGRRFDPATESERRA
jgi:hypothetical protein